MKYLEKTEDLKKVENCKIIKDDFPPVDQEVMFTKLFKCRFNRFLIKNYIIVLIFFLNLEFITPQNKVLIKKKGALSLD